METIVKHAQRLVYSLLCLVVTRNQKDFGKVPNLQVENWAV
ncbi:MULTISPECIES: hypothetical protein [Pseudanabaena]|nr:MULTISPECIES: hypothetical protein [Pseudanabaena]MEA5487516.1 hypothetical protein [Pseudanabaena sp. CCNP1317]WGS74007.1 hypothetical protein OA858_08265 [Pseudanabaena galeata CCNP1313]